MKKSGKNRELCKKVDFWPALLKIFGCHGNVKNHGHTIDISKFLRKMNEKLLKVSAF